MSTLLIVGGLDETIVKAKALGLKVLVLQHPSKVTDETPKLADVLRVVDFTEWPLVEPIVRELHASPGFDAAISLTEPGLEAAGRINDLFGLGGTGFEVTRLIRDKWAMRQHLSGRDPAAVKAAPLRERDDLVVFGQRHGYPFIVKPRDATASIGVSLVESPADLDRVWHTVQSLRGTRTDRISTLFVLQDFLMEEYLVGPEYSVESFSFAGRHVVITITEKFTEPGHFGELGHAVPARLPKEVGEQVRGAVRRFLDLMGLRDGVCHTEVKVTADGPRIIEGHNRYGGDAIPELVRAAYGIDLATLAVGWPFGLVDELPDEPAPHAGACTRFLVVDDAGEVESIDGVEALRGQEGVLTVQITAKVGGPAQPLRDNWDRLGLVAVKGSDTSDAIERAGRYIGDVLRLRVAGADGQQRPARVGHAVQVGVARKDALLIIHRNPFEPFPYHQWLHDYRGDIVILAAREKFAPFGEPVPAGNRGYRHLEVLERFDDDVVRRRALEMVAEFGITQIIALHEADVDTAAWLREHLGMPGAWSADVRPFRDKALMKRLLAAADVEIAPHLHATTADQARAFAAAHGLPLVGKERNGYNSIGLSIMRTPDEVEAWLERTYANGPREDRLVEAFVAGRMCHVDGLVVDGRTVLAWPSQYQYDLASFGSDPGARIDLTLDPDDPLTPRLLALTEKALAALKSSDTRLRHHAFHAEIFHTTDDRLVVCEVAGRTAGAKIREVLEALFGINTAEYVMRAELGLPLPKLAQTLSGGPLPAPRAMSGQMLMMKRPGVVKALPSIPQEAWVSRYWLFAHPGQVIPPAAGSADFLLAAVAIGQSRAQAEQRLRELGSRAVAQTEIVED